MSKSIAVSQKHGLNPTIPVCFYCGKSKNEIALLGKLKGDAEAPRNAILDYSPCDECQSQWEQGLPVVEVNDRPNTPNQPPWSKKHSDVYPTGRMLVLRREAVNPGLAEAPMCFSTIEEFSQILKQGEEQ